MLGTDVPPTLRAVQGGEPVTPEKFAFHPLARSAAFVRESWLFVKGRNSGLSESDDALANDRLQFAKRQTELFRGLGRKNSGTEFSNAIIELACKRHVSIVHNASGDCSDRGHITACRRSPGCCEIALSLTTVLHCRRCKLSDFSTQLA